MLHNGMWNQLHVSVKQMRGSTQQTCIFIIWQDTVYLSLQSLVDWFREAVGVPMETKYNTVLFGGKLKVYFYCSTYTNIFVTAWQFCIIFFDKITTICIDHILSGLIGSLFSLLQFLSSPLTGALSDHHGRKPLLILTTVGAISSTKLNSEMFTHNNELNNLVHLATPIFRHWFITFWFILVFWGGECRQLISLILCCSWGWCPPMRSGQSLKALECSSCPGWLGVFVREM